MIATILLALLLAAVFVAITVLAFVYFGTRTPPYLNDLSSKNACIVVTGAASGIGQSTVEILLEKGSFVFALDMNEDLLKKNYEKNSNVKSMKVNIADEEQVKQCVVTINEELQKKKQKLFGLVNCAGILYKEFSALVEHENELEMKRMFDVNFFGMARLTRLLFPTLQQNGSIVNVASIAALMALPYMSYYSATKFAVRGYSDCLRRELFGIVRVTCVEPGGTKSAIAAHNPQTNENSAHKERVKAMFSSMIAGGGDPIMQGPEQVGQVIVNSLFSSNAPSHVIADTWGNRLKYFMGHAFGTDLMDNNLKKAYGNLKLIVKDKNQ